MPTATQTPLKNWMKKMTDALSDDVSQPLVSATSPTSSVNPIGPEQLRTDLALHYAVRGGIPGLRSAARSCCSRCGTGPRRFSGDCSHAPPKRRNPPKRVPWCIRILSIQPAILIRRGRPVRTSASSRHHLALRLRAWLCAAKEARQLISSKACAR